MRKGQGVRSSAVMQESEKKYSNREEKSDCLMWNNSCVFEAATGESWLRLPSSCRCFCGSGTERKKVIAQKWLMVYIQLCARTSVGICFVRSYNLCLICVMFLLYSLITSLLLKCLESISLLPLLRLSYCFYHSHLHEELFKLPSHLCSSFTLRARVRRRQKHRHTLSCLIR